ncbi:MAG: LysM domain, partial [Bacteroidota bacterium]
QQGETFFGIAKFYEMNLDDLIKLNPYSYKNGLKIGDILKIN